MAKRKYMWGAWVVWHDGHEDWINECGCQDDNGSWTSTFADSPYAFGGLKKDIMPLVKHWRGQYGVKSCTPVKVPMPEGPADE